MRILNCPLPFKCLCVIANIPSPFISGILAGYQMAFDVGSSKLTKSNFAVGYSAGNLTFHTCVNNGSEVAGSLHQKHSDKLETALNASYAR